MGDSTHGMPFINQDTKLSEEFCFMLLILNLIWYVINFNQS